MTINDWTQVLTRLSMYDGANATQSRTLHVYGSILVYTFVSIYFFFFDASSHV